MSTVMTTNRVQPRYPEGPTAADLPVSQTSNTSLVLRLHMTPNHLSRWLTPITNQTPLYFPARRGEPSVIGLLKRMRDEELHIYPRMHLIANEINPDLDRLPDLRGAADAEDETVFKAMAEFRRLRMSTCSLLRALPDAAWMRVGTSRREHDWQIRALAEHLVHHDIDCLYAMDIALDNTGARGGINSAARVHLDEILRLIPLEPK
jgi:hypothetical protein